MRKLFSTLKGKIIFGAAAAGVVSAVVVIGVLLSRSEGYRTISLEEVAGNCQITNDDGQENAYKGMHLYSGDEVSVGEKSSLTMLLDMDKYVYADENTYFRLEAEGSEESGRTIIHLEEGSELNWLKTDLSEGETYEVNTPNSAMAVRGTVFRVTVYYDENGMVWTEVEVYQGKVEISLKTTDGKFNGVTELFTEGQAALIRGNSELSEFVEGDDGEIHRRINYKEIPQNVVGMLLRCMDAGEKLCIGKELLMDYAKLEEHQPESSVTKEPTCTEEGSREIRCAVCGELIETETTAAMGHKLGEAEVTASTCMTKGTSVQSCTNPGCTYAVTEELPLAEHVYGAWTTKAATCTASGSQTRKCNVCGAAETQTIAATGHQPGAAEVTASTCMTKGTSVQSCTNPGCTYAVTEELPLAEHKSEEWVIDQPATCTTTGSKTRTCSECKKVIETETIPATGHDLSLTHGEIIFGQTESVQVTIVCKNCDYSNKEIHTISNYDKLKETYFCEDCQETFETMKY